MATTVTPVSGEILVNTVTTSQQRQPSVTALANGGFVVLWMDANNLPGDPAGTGGNAIRAQLFDAAGAKVGGMFLAGIDFVTDSAPGVATLTDGSFVVTWTSNSDGTVRGQRFDAAGAKIGSGFSLGLSPHDVDPMVAALPNGGFVVTWTDEPSASDFNVKAQLFTAAGAKDGSEFLVNTTTQRHQEDPAISVLSNGNFVVTWRDDSPISSSLVKAQLFSSTGTKIGGEISVGTNANFDLNPAIAALANGGFVVTYQSLDNSGGISAIGYYTKARLFDASGAAIGNPITVSTDFAGTAQAGQHVLATKVTALPSGGFVVTWVNHNSGIIEAQLFDATGAKVGSTFDMVTNNVVDAASNTGQPATMLANGNLVATWTVLENSGAASWETDIHAQIFSVAGNGPAVVSIAPQNAVQSEGNSGTKLFTFMVSLDHAAAGGQSVNWTVTGSGTHPTDAADFGGALPQGTITFAAGETIKTVSVAVSGDTTVELDEGFTVALSNPSAGLALGTASAAGTILNDDTVAVVTHGDAYILQQDHALTIASTAGVLSNDQSTTAMTASLVTGTTHGTLQLAANGGFTYTPAAGFAGIDTFSYHASNGASSADEQALLYVVPVNVGASTTLNLLALNAEEQIASTYVAFFGRAADAGGFQFWVGEFNRGLPVQGPAALFANIASSFGVSNEAKALYPFLVNPFGASDGQISAFLDSVYNNMFNRSSDAGGLAYWTGQIKQTLQAGQFVGSVLINIMSGAQDTAVGKDITTLMGKVAVSLAYVQEQQEHHTVWAGASDTAAATGLLQPVAADAQTVLIGIKNAEALIAAHA